MSENERRNEALRGIFCEPVERANASLDCPADAEIWDAGRGKLPPERIRELLSHSLECSTCAESWKVAAALAEEHGEVDARRARARPPKVRYLIAAAAVGILLLLILTPLVRRQADATSALLAREVQSTIWRVGEDADEALATGDAVRPGDRLYLRVMTDEEVHLYVINRDLAGDSYLLFPIEDAQWTNPLPAASTYRIPGETSWTYDSWEVSSAGGKESFYVVASRAPLHALESALALLQAATPGPSAVRGDDPDGDTVKQAEANAAIDAALDGLTASGDPEDHVIRTIVLDNPR